MLNPMRDKLKARTGGEKGRHLWPRLVQKIAEGKTSYELSWKAKVMKKKGRKNHTRSGIDLSDLKDLAGNMNWESMHLSYDV